MYVRVEIDYLDFYFDNSKDASKFCVFAYLGSKTGDIKITMHFITEEEYLEHIQAEGA